MLLISLNSLFISKLKISLDLLLWPLLSSETFLPYSEPYFSPALRRRSPLFAQTSHTPYISKKTNKKNTRTVKVKL